MVTSSLSVPPKPPTHELSNLVTKAISKKPVRDFREAATRTTHERIIKRVFRHIVRQKVQVAMGLNSD